ncbi:MAG: hypothetical protein K0V04_19205 [Deltaproteobacteria bacterium]|nr:hypothetical protein [Deltaproteobacteria bacterium]
MKFTIFFLAAAVVVIGCDSYVEVEDGPAVKELASMDSQDGAELVDELLGAGFELDQIEAQPDGTVLLGRAPASDDTGLETIKRLVDVGFGRANIEIQEDGSIVVNNEVPLHQTTTNLVSEDGMQAVGFCIGDDALGAPFYCGTQSPFGCWCDHACITFGDCCFDGPC